MSHQNKVRVIFEAVMTQFQQSVQRGIRSVLQIGDASKTVSRHFKGVADEANHANSSIEKLNTTVKNLFSLMAAKAATQTLIGLGTDLTKEYAKTQTAIGEMASLGYENSELLRETAIDFSNKWAGTTREGFISSAYSIKSGIASLSDEAVAQFTELAGVTAKATKATVDEMTSLFATGHGIYRELYNDDFDFGESFSVGIAKAVQLFKTSGSEMSGYLSTLGASAVQAGAELSEVVSIGGTLQATMTGSEAATKYNSFLKNAVKASSKLKMNFTDSHNRLLPAVDILEKIKQKYGQILDANEQVELVEAFGDDEAVKFITGLYNKTENLRQSQEDVTQAINQGKEAVEEMAEAMNRGMAEKMALVQQRWANLKDEIGKQMEPGISPALDAIGDKLLELQQSGDFSALGQSFGALTEVLGNTLINNLGQADEVIRSITQGIQWLANNIDLLKALLVGGISFKVFLSAVGFINQTATSMNSLNNRIKDLTGGLGGLKGAFAVLQGVFKSNWIGIVITSVILLIKWINHLFESTSNFKDFWKLAWLEIQRLFLIVVEGILKGIQMITDGLVLLAGSIPIIGDLFKGLSNQVNNWADNAKNRVDEVNQSISELIGKSKELNEVDLSTDTETLAVSKSSVVLEERPSQLPITEVSAASSFDKHTIQDDIDDIAEQYDYKVDLYESRAEVAEKKKDKVAVKSNKESMITVLNNQVKALAGLEKKVTGKDKNIVETAKNKLLSKIADISESINKSIDQLVGEFNKSSELTTMSKYEYLTSTSQTANSKYINNNNIEILIKLNDLGNTSMSQLNNKLGQIAQMAGTQFSGKNSLITLGMNDVTRN